MKTPHKRNGVPARPQINSAARSRAQRTAAQFACESLEGRKLMTGFAGAGPMMGHGFAEMGDQGGGGLRLHDQMDRFGGPDAATAQGGTATTDTSASGGTNAATPQGWTPTFAHDGRTDTGRDFGGPGGLGGRMGDGFQGPESGDRAVPMTGAGGQNGSGSDSTGSTQLKTDMDKLRTDEQSIHDKSQVTPALQAAVRKDLEAIDAAKTGTASDAATQQLKNDEQTIFGTQSGSTTTTPTSPPTAPPTLTDAQKATLQADHDAILKSQGVSQDLIDQLAKDQLAVKTASNFTDADQATLDADHKAIQADLDALRSTAPATATPTATPTTPPTATPATPDATVTTTATTATPATTDPASTPAPVEADPSTTTNTSVTPPSSAPAAPTGAATDPTATAPQAMPNQPGSVPGDAARPRMSHHRGGIGGEDAQFFHQVSTANQGTDRSGGLGARGSGVGGGHARGNFRR